MELKRILSIILRQRRLIIFILLGVVSLFVVLTLLVEPRYEAKSRVYLRKSLASIEFFSAAGLLASSVSTVDDTERYNYLTVARSSPVLEKVIDDLHLTRNRKWYQLIEMIPLMPKVARMMGIVKPARKPLLPSQLRHKEILSFFFPRPYVSVEQFQDTDLLLITATSYTLEESLQLANGVAREFSEQLVEMHRSDFKHLSKMVKEALPETEERVKQTQKAVQKFKEKFGYVDISTYSSSLTTLEASIRSRIDDNELDLTAAKGQLASIRKQLESRPKFNKSAMTSERNPALDSLKSSLQTLHLNLAEARAKYTDEHSTIIAQKIQEADLIKRMKIEAQKIFSTETLSTDTVYSMLLSSLSSQAVDIAGLESMLAANRVMLQNVEEKLRQVPEAYAVYTRLTAAQTAAEDFYSTLLNGLARLESAGGMTVSFVDLIEPATPPETPAKAKHPKLFIILVIGLFLGMLLALGMALLLEYLNETILELTEETTPVDWHALGEVPLLAAKEMPAPDREDMPPALREALRGVVTRLLFLTDRRDPEGLLIASPGRSEGKTFLAIYLARTLALLGRRVLLVDGDLREPHLHTALGEDNNLMGFAECLRGQTTLEDAVRQHRVDGIDVLYAGKSGDDPAGLVDSPALPELLHLAKERYDVVLLISSPLIEAVDSAVMATYMEATMLVAAYGRTKDGSFFHAARTLKNGSALRVAVLNMAGDLTRSRPLSSYISRWRGR